MFQKSNSTLQTAAETREMEVNRKLAEAQSELEEMKRGREYQLEKHRKSISQLKLDLELQRALVSHK